MREIRNLLLLFVVLAVVPTNRQNLTVVQRQSHNIRNLNARRLAVLVNILIPVKVEINVALQKRAVVINVRRLKTTDLVRHLRYFGHLFLRRNHLNVAVKSRNLHLAHVVQRRRHHLRDVRARVQIRRVVRNNKILRRHKTAHDPAHRLVVIRLLERRTRQRKHKQHLVHVRRVFLHHVRDVVIHKRLDPTRLLLLLTGLLAHNRRLHRTLRRQKLVKRLRLKLRRSLRQQRMRHTRRTAERLRPLVIRKTKKLKPLRVRLRPLAARLVVRVILRQKLARNAL